MCWFQQQQGEEIDMICQIWGTMACVTKNVNNKQYTNVLFFRKVQIEYLCLNYLVKGGSLMLPYHWYKLWFQRWWQENFCILNLQSYLVSGTWINQRRWQTSLTCPDTGLHISKFTPKHSFSQQMRGQISDSPAILGMHFTKTELVKMQIWWKIWSTIYIYKGLRGVHMK